jgi:hypothetical protein
MPPEILVYEFDQDEDGQPMYTVARNVEDIPEDRDGKKVGSYVLNTTSVFRVRRSLG